jgi:alpha-tubulin suppressor-like RCC1 family protein
VVVIKYRSVSAGAMHACDIASGGIAWCWGLNGREGRIGLPTLADGLQSSEPVQVPGGHRFVQLSTYGSHTCGLTREGRAYCWGYNGWGHLGNGTSTTSSTPVAVQGGLTFRQISAGGAHTCGVTTDNRAYCWGFGQSGELGRGSTASSNVPVAVSGNLSIASITAGSDYTCAVTTSGQGQCWGYSGLGNLGDGGKISFGNTYVTVPQAVVGGQAFRALSASKGMTCGVNTAGSAFCWGANSGRIGNGGSTETSTPSAVSGGLSFRAVSAGFNHSCGVTNSDEVWCWGANTSGQLGMTIGNGSNVPVRAGGSLAAAEVSAANIATGSASFTCAISADRLTTYCWGRNDVGQLGNGATTTSAAINSTPSIVVGQKPLPRTR